MNNSIGQFKIGVSQIGGIEPFNFINTIISQYANSPILFQLIENFNSYLDQTGNIDNLFDTLFDVDTAQGIGLDIIGRIIGVSRILPVTAGGYFSFAGGDANGEFGQAPFYSGQPLTSNYALSDTAFRTVILAKARANLSDASIPAINQLLLTLFKNRGDCHVVDNNNMTMNYVFNFKLTAVEQALVTNSGMLPHPSGVAVAYTFN